MKITFNPTTKTQETDKQNRLIQNSSNNYVYLYGVVPGWLVKATFTRRDNVKIGNIAGVYNTDPDGTYCYVIKVPTQAVEIDKQLAVSLNLYEPDGQNYITHSTIDTAAYVYPNSGVIIPDDLATLIADQLNLAISSLTTGKHDAASINGIEGETINKATEIFSKLKVLQELAQDRSRLTALEEGMEDYFNKEEVNQIFSQCLTQENLDAALVNLDTALAEILGE